MSQSIRNYIFRRLALDYLDFDARSALGIYSVDERNRQLDIGSYAPLVEESEVESLITTPPIEPIPLVEDSTPPVEPVETKGSKQAPRGAHTSAEPLEAITGSTVDSPLCITCRTKMRPAGSCYVCEGCGSTSIAENVQAAYVCVVLGKEE